MRKQTNKEKQENKIIRKRRKQVNKEKGKTREEGK